MDGKTKYAHLFDPKVTFGELKNKEKTQITPANPAELNEEKIRLSLSYRAGIDPTLETELIFGEWFAHELVGNRVGLSFHNGLTLEEQMVTSFGDLRTFTPALSLQGFDLTLKIDGYEIMQKPDKDHQKTVVKLEITAMPALFPLVKLEVTLTNSEGKLVEGLSATDFSIVDNESPVKAIMENNQRTPKVLILYDISLSMPLEYLDEGMDSFIDTLEKSILTKYPAARLERWPTDSSLFTWLLKASQTSNDLIIFATDGDNDDTFDPKMEPFFKSGPPAVVGELYGILFDGTGGGARSIETQLQDIDKVVEAYGKVLDHMSKRLSGALPIVAMYSKTLVKLYAIASVAIVIMDDSNVNKEVRKAMIDLANDVAKHIAEL